MKLKTLSIFTGCLFILSIIVFINENKRGTDILSGSDYIKGLDIENISKISVKFKDNKKIIFKRDAKHFLLENHKSYQVAPDKINDLIYNIASIQVQEKITSNASASDLKKYELNANNSKYFVKIFDNSGKKTISLNIGKNYRSKGNYLYRESTKDIYLSKGRISISPSFKNFIDQSLLKIKKENIQKVSLLSSKNMQIDIESKEDKFLITLPASGNYDETLVSKYLNDLSSINFEDFFTYSESRVNNLNFNQEVRIKLKDNLTYKISLQKDKEEFFAKINVIVNEIPKQLTINKNDNKEKLEKIESIMSAQRNAQRINIKMGRWIYKIGKDAYDKLVRTIAFFEKSK